MTKALVISPEVMRVMKAASKDMFNPPPEAAAWMSANRPSEAEIMAMLEEYYLREMPCSETLQ